MIIQYILGKYCQTTNIYLTLQVHSAFVAEAGTVAFVAELTVVALVAKIKVTAVVTQLERSGHASKSERLKANFIISIFYCIFDKVKPLITRFVFVIPIEYVIVALPKILKTFFLECPRFITSEIGL